jgi:hypothetical protein
MFWIVSLLITYLFCLVVYSQRYSKRKISGIQIVQFLYLFVAAPLIGTCLLNIGLDIASRPLQITIIPDFVLLPLAVFTTIVGCIGAGIHSTSVVTEELLSHEKTTRAFRFNNRIHGVISHQMAYQGSIFLSVLFLFLELNHPRSYQDISMTTFVLIGMILGLFFALSILWSTYVVYNLLFTTLCLGLVAYFIPLIIQNSHIYPVSMMTITLLVTLDVLLLLSLLVYKKSKRLSRIVVTMIFPRGHSLREQFLS